MISYIKSISHKRKTGQILMVILHKNKFTEVKGDYIYIKYTYVCIYIILPCEINTEPTLYIQSSDSSKILHCLSLSSLNYFPSPLFLTLILHVSWILLSQPIADNLRAFSLLFFIKLKIIYNIFWSYTSLPPCPPNFMSSLYIKNYTNI